MSVCWLPLLILSLAQGLAYDRGLQIPFVRDFAVNVRFLISLPILIMAEFGIDRRLRAIVIHFVDSGLVKVADLPSFEAALKNFMAVDVENLSWTFFLWQVSHVKLHLVPTHPDQSAGLGFLSEGQRRLAPIVFAGGTVIAGQVANAITYQGATLTGLKFVMIGYGVMAILSLVAPLLLMSPKLMKVKRQGILDYGALANSYTQSFDDKWVHGKRVGEPLLGSSDIQSLADLNNSFAIVRDMRPVPVNKNTLIALALAAILPLVPVILLVTPADELVRAILKMLA